MLPHWVIKDDDRFWSGAGEYKDLFLFLPLNLQTSCTLSIDTRFIVIEIDFLTVLEVGSLRSRCELGWFLLRLLSLAGRPLFSPCVYVGHLLPVSQSPLLVRTPVRLD